MRPRTPTGPTPGRPSARPGPAAPEAQAIDELIHRLRYAQGQVNAMMTQLQQITRLLHDAQRAGARGGATRAPLDPATAGRRPAGEHRRGGWG